MSTYIYATCKSHTPPLRADGESGQHLYDLPDLRADIANREAVVAKEDADEFGTRNEHWFRLNTARFLAMHRQCEIGIVDQYGREYPVVEGQVPEDE